MKADRKRDLKKSGIYVIKNLITNKIYVGKAVCIYTRIGQHKSLLNSKSNDENRHLINSWHKYGPESFSYYVLEYLERNENLLKEREYYWITTLNALDRNIGYNLRLDTSSQCIVSEETRKRCSISGKKRYDNDPQAKIDVGIRTSKFWKENPEAKEQMKLALKKKKQEKYEYHQLDENRNIIKIFSTVDDIIAENPTYKWQNIYSVCNGYKKRIYGYKWERHLKQARKEIDVFNMNQTSLL